MAFYIVNSYGADMVQGRRFETLEAAEAAAQKSIRITARKARAGYTGLDVMEEVPGRHRLRSVVWPDKVERAA